VEAVRYLVTKFLNAYTIKVSHIMIQNSPLAISAMLNNIKSILQYICSFAEAYKMNKCVVLFVIIATLLCSPTHVHAMTLDKRVAEWVVFSWPKPPTIVEQAIDVDPNNAADSIEVVPNNVADSIYSVIYNTDPILLMLSTATVSVLSCYAWMSIKKLSDLDAQGLSDWALKRNILLQKLKDVYANMLSHIDELMPIMESNRPLVLIIQNRLAAANVVPLPDTPADIIQFIIDDVNNPIRLALAESGVSIDQFVALYRLISVYAKGARLYREYNNYISNQLPDLKVPIEMWPYLKNTAPIFDLHNNALESTRDSQIVVDHARRVLRVPALSVQNPVSSQAMDGDAMQEIMRRTIAFSI
jgi:hypothetical protein